MKSIAFIRAALFGLVAAVSSGCVETTGYDYQPRVYRDEYDRGFNRPDYLVADRRNWRRYDRHERGPRYHQRERYERSRYDRNRPDGWRPNRMDGGNFRGDSNFSRIGDGRPDRGSRHIRVRTRATR